MFCSFTMVSFESLPIVTFQKIPPQLNNTENIIAPYHLAQAMESPILDSTEPLGKEEEAVLRPF